MLFSTVIGAIVNVVLNFILVVPFKHNGVAIASAITELSVAVYQFFVVKKIVNIRVEKRFVLTIFIGTIIMALFVIMCNFFIKSALQNLIVSMILGTGVYFLITCITGNEMSICIVNSFKKYKMSKR